MLKLLKSNGKVGRVQKHWNFHLGRSSRVSALHDEDEALLLGGESVLHPAGAGVERLIRPLRIFALLSCAPAAVARLYHFTAGSLVRRGKHGGLVWSQLRKAQGYRLNKTEIGWLKKYPQREK